MMTGAHNSISGESLSDAATTQAEVHTSNDIVVTGPGGGVDRCHRRGAKLANTSRRCYHTHW